MYVVFVDVNCFGKGLGLILSTSDVLGSVYL